MQEGGIYTVEQLAHSNRRELVAIKGLSDAKVEKLISAGMGLKKTYILFHTSTVVIYRNISSSLTLSV